MDRKRIIEITMDECTKVYIEADDYQEFKESDPLLLPTSSSDKLINKTKHFLDASYNQVKTFADGIATRIKTLETAPDEFELEFGVKFSAEAGALISSVSTDANIIIKMKWNKET